MEDSYRFYRRNCLDLGFGGLAGLLLGLGFGGLAGLLLGLGFGGFAGLLHGLGFGSTSSCCGRCTAAATSASGLCRKGSVRN